MVAPRFQGWQYVWLIVYYNFGVTGGHIHLAPFNKISAFQCGQMRKLDRVKSDTPTESYEHRDGRKSKGQKCSFFPLQAVSNYAENPKKGHYGCGELAHDTSAELNPVERAG